MLGWEGRSRLLPMELVREVDTLFDVSSDEDGESYKKDRFIQGGFC